MYLVRSHLSRDLLLELEDQSVSRRISMPSIFWVRNAQAKDEVTLHRLCRDLTKAMTLTALYIYPLSK